MKHNLQKGYKPVTMLLCYEKQITIGDDLWDYRIEIFSMCRSAKRAAFLYGNNYPVNFQIIIKIRLKRLY